MPEAPPPNPSQRSETEPPNPTPEQQPPPEPPPEVMPDATPDDLRAEVRKLRDEAAEGRVKGKRAETLTERLVHALAANTRRLADPSDLPVSADLLDDDGLPDPGKVEAAVEALLTAKPHLASRTPRGDIGQGARDDAETVNLSGMLRAGAG